MITRSDIEFDARAVRFFGHAVALTHLQATRGRKAVRDAARAKSRQRRRLAGLLALCVLPLVALVLL
jgi:hypothetical protein